MQSTTVTILHTKSKLLQIQLKINEQLFGKHRNNKTTCGFFSKKGSLPQTYPKRGHSFLSFVLTHHHQIIMFSCIELLSCFYSKIIVKLMKECSLYLAIFKQNLFTIHFERTFGILAYFIETFSCWLVQLLKVNF